MRVAMVGPFPRPGRPVVGGIEAVSQNLVAALGQLGVEVTVVTDSAEGRRPERFRHDAVDYRVLPVAHRRRSRLSWFALERRAVTEELRQVRPDVVHVQGANYFAPAALRAPFPTVLTPHGIFFREARITDAASGPLERVSKRLRGLGNAAFERGALRRAGDLVIISPYVEQALAGRTTGRLHRIPNPVAGSFYRVERRPVPGQVLFVGTIDPRKNVLTLVDAFDRVAASHPEARLRLAGKPVDARYHAAVRAAIGRRSWRDRVVELGLVAPEPLLEEYSRASVLVLPSRQESAPMAVQQAMAAGVPVVASRVGGIDLLVAEGESGLLVAPDDTDALAAALMAMLDQPARAGQMGDAGRLRADPFRPEKVAAATLEVYREVVKRQVRTS